MDFLKHVKSSDKILFVLVALMIFTAGFQVGKNFSFLDSVSFATSNNDTLDKAFNFDPLSDVWSQVSTEYVHSDEVTKQATSYGIAKGLVDALDDPYSVFLTPEETKLFHRDLDQELEGIGAEITQEEGVLKVVSPLKGSPAEKGGLKTGDIIIKINEEDTATLNLFEAIEKIRGEKGSTVKLTVIRENEKSALELVITRDVIELESITTKEMDDIFYVSINQFSDDTTKEFNNVVAEILLNNPKGLIIDLRFNGGGYLQTAVDILGEFLPRESVAVIVESGAEKQKEILKTTGKNRLPDLPIIVLINEGSASASEIMAGALQDLGRATIIGQQSYGKGSVQKIEQFRDGSSLRLTIAKWLTPNGNDINKKGITPNLLVEISDSDYEKGIDTQLEKAKQYLKNSFLTKK